MKVLHVLTDFFPTVGGVQVCVDQLMRRQLDAGHDVHIACSLGSWSLYRSVMPYRMWPLLAGARVFDHWIDVVLDYPRLLSGLWLRGIVQRIKPDLLHAHLAMSSGLLATAIPMGVPVVTTCHGTDVQINADVGYGVTLTAEGTRATKRSLDRSTIVSVVSREMMRDCQRIGGDGILGKLAHVPNGVSCHRFIQIQSDRRTVREHYGIPEQSFAIVCVGRNHPKKDFRIAVDVAEMLVNSGVEFTFILVGRDHEPLMALAAERRLVDYFVLAGAFAPDTSGLGSDSPPEGQVRLMKACDAMFLPSLIEGFPLVVPEALCCGLGVVTTHESCVGDSFSNHVCKCFPARNAPRAVDCLKRIYQNCGENGFRGECIAEAIKFDWGEVQMDYQRVYRDAIRRFGG